ncbi:MAG: butyrate kinase [Desulfitibacter sp. BRH_c19]|nr:MAG: butyrate kinase [Desulfitibacter sp. BRH_c19]
MLDLGYEWLLVINPGSTSTKTAVFKGDDLKWSGSLEHTVDDLKPYDRIVEQFSFRKQVIERALIEQGFDLQGFCAVAARGGLLKHVQGGTYLVNEQMLTDLKECKYGEHASNLGALVANELASSHRLPAYIVDPVVVDELNPSARISGMPGISRKSIFHALNQKAVARRYCREHNKNYEEVNLIIAHLGGGISVGAHERGRVVDVNNALNGEGPFSPERAGGLPVGEVIGMSFSGDFTQDQLRKQFVGQGGMAAYLGTNDARIVEERIQDGDEKAKLIYHAMGYQVAKEICACGGVLLGKMEAVILTGGLAYSKMLTGWIKERVKFLAPVVLYPGEDEMDALAQGVLRVLRREEEALIY